MRPGETYLAFTTNIYASWILVLKCWNGLRYNIQEEKSPIEPFHPGARSTGFTSLGIHTYYEIQPVGSTCKSEHGDVFLLLRPTSVSRGYSCSNAGTGLVDTASKKRGRQDRAFRIFMHTHKFRTIY